MAIHDSDELETGISPYLNINLINFPDTINKGF